MWNEADDARQGLPSLAPQGFYVSGEDNLRLTVLNALTGVTVTVSGRFMDTAGKVSPFVRTLVPATDRTASTLTFPLGDGWILSVQVVATAAAPIAGQTFAMLTIVRGFSGAVTDLATLVAGFCTAVQRLAWPGQMIQSSLDGGGALRSIMGSVPSAGAEVNETVPTGARWEVLAVRVRLINSATVANRNPALVFDDQANEFFSSSMSTNMTASNVWYLNWGQGTPSVSSAVFNDQLTGLPVNMRLLAGYRIRTRTNAMQVGDEYSAPQLLVREWLEAA